MTCTITGIYADSDTLCVKPIARWTDRQQGLVVGVEAQNVDTRDMGRHEGNRAVVFSQYVFAAGAFHPALVRMLYRLVDDEETLLGAASPSLSPEDRLHAVIRTIDPMAWTDDLAEFLCYAQSGHFLTPDDFWRGGQAPTLRVLPIAGFGADQTHLGSPWTDDDPDICVLRKFKRSGALHGESRLQATE